MHYSYKGWAFGETNTGPGHKPVPGTDKLKEAIGTTVQDAMRSSIDYFNSYGYKKPHDDDIVNDVFEGDIEPKYHARARYKGMFNIPVCEFESSKQWSDYDPDSAPDRAWPYIIQNQHDGSITNGIQ